MPHKGYKQPPEVIAAKSAAQRGRKQRPEWIAKRIASRLETLRERGFPRNTGPKNEATRQAAAERMRAMWKDPEWRAKAITACSQKRGPMPEYRRRRISARLKGRQQAPELIAKRAMALRGRKISVAQIAALQAGRRAKPLSEESRMKMSNSQRGRRHSPETKIKIGIGQKNRPPASDETRAKISASQKGKKASQLTRIRLSQMMKNRGWSGSRHPNWKGGVTSENATLRNQESVRQWCKAVMQRDGYTCRNCFKKGGQLNAHHILFFKRWPQFRTELWNGRTLCSSCHWEVHRAANAETRASGRKLQ